LFFRREVSDDCHEPHAECSRSLADRGILVSRLRASNAELAELTR
jgi:hypothetical protein